MSIIITTAIVGLVLLILGVTVRMVIDGSSPNDPPEFVVYFLAILGLFMFLYAFYKTDSRSEKITAHCFHHKEEILHRSPDKIQDLDGTCIEIFKRYYTSENNNKNGGE